VRDVFAVKTSVGYLTLGRIEAAERAAAKILDPIVRNDLRAQISFFRGDALALKNHLQLPGNRTLGSVQTAWWETTAILQARAGLLSAARRFQKTEEQPVGRPQEDRPELHTVLGEIELAKGDLAGAILELEQATELSVDWRPNRPAFFLNSESLAAALKKTGNVKRAIEVLERASERRIQAVSGAFSLAGAYWLRSRFELARLYREVGRVEDARTIEADLEKLLARADADHPILVALKARGATS
jgi:tetratricopeptide (TPR) repeat protein